MATDLQIKAVKELVENGRNKGKALVKVGYSKNTAKAPTKVTQSKGFKEASIPVIEQMVEERQRAINAMKGKISKAKYRDLVDSADKLTKNIQLLSGKATDMSRIVFMPKELIDKFNLNGTDSSAE